LGSITKQFTAASVLLLQERGKLNVNDPVKNFTSFPEYSKWEPFATTPAEEVARFRDKPLDFAPGEKWSYSNSGYLLLGYLIEKITGGNYETFVRENIFTPLGIQDSGYHSNSAVTARRASGYSLAKDGLENAGFVHMSIPHAAGALYSTTGDLWKWEQGLFGGKLLAAASLETITTPFKNNYASGLAVETKGGHKAIEHDGGIEGFATFLSYFPDDKLTVVVLGNVASGAPGEIAAKLAAVAHGEAVTLQAERKEIQVAPEVLAKYAGTYELTPGATVTMTVEGGHLMIQLTGQPKVELFAESETKFFLKVVDAQVGL
jgi:CubicO group peptidase (beta-lactamase class C family)